MHGLGVESLPGRAEALVVELLDGSRPTPFPTGYLLNKKKSGPGPAKNTFGPSPLKMGLPTAALIIASFMSVCSQKLGTAPGIHAASALPFSPHRSCRSTICVSPPQHSTA